MRTPARPAIIAATRDLLEEVALDDLSVARIAVRAGVTRQAFYLHFATRDEVVAELLRQVVDDLQRAVDLFVEGARVRSARTSCAKASRRPGWCGRNTARRYGC